MASVHRVQCYSVYDCVYRQRSTDILRQPSYRCVCQHQTWAA